MEWLKLVDLEIQENLNLVKRTITSSFLKKKLKKDRLRGYVEQAVFIIV